MSRRENNAGRRSDGYVVFEILTAIVFVVVLGVAVVPPVVEELQAGKVERARSEAEIIAQAVLDFHRDVGVWPLAVDGGSDLCQLVGNEILGGGRHGIPPTSSPRTNQPMVAQAALGTMTAHLVRNGTAQGEPIYPISTHPHVQQGWNGPYLEEVPLDPWGNPYVVNIWPSRQTQDADVLAVLSAGPDGIFETPVAAADFGGILAGDLVGDDIGLAVQQTR